MALHLIARRRVVRGLREQPFNLKRGGGGGGYGFFWGGEKFSVGKFALNFILSLTWVEKKYSVSTMCLKIYCFCRKKLCHDNLWRKQNSAALQSETKYFDSEKKPSLPL